MQITIDGLKCSIRVATQNPSSRYWNTNNRTTLTCICGWLSTRETLLLLLLYVCACLYSTALRWPMCASPSHGLWLEKTLKLEVPPYDLFFFHFLRRLRAEKKFQNQKMRTDPRELFELQFIFLRPPLILILTKYDEILRTFRFHKIVRRLIFLMYFFFQIWSNQTFDAHLG